MQNIDNEISRHSNHLHIATMLIFPQSKFIESDDKSQDDHAIVLCDDLAVQIGIDEQYYVVVRYDRDVDDFKTSHTMFEPAEVFAFIQEIACGHNPFLNITDLDNQTMLDAQHFVDAEFEKYPSFTYEDMAIHLKLKSVEILEVKSILYLESMWYYLDNNFQL